MFKHNGYKPNLWSQTALVVICSSTSSLIPLYVSFLIGKIKNRGTYLMKL